MEEEKKTIWTIGHSTHSLEDFVTLLQKFAIEQLVDIRHYPGSRRFPHFNKEMLSNSLPSNGIGYAHLKQLGGRRKPKTGSTNTAWRLPAFRGYADYMETPDFEEGIKQLEELALQKRTVYMCSEARWWSCHRSLISDYLKVRGWTVLHIMNAAKAQEHPYTAAASIINGELSYKEANELF
jgi:uncharacterized protein (DUF488 family)